MYKSEFRGSSVTLCGAEGRRIELQRYGTSTEKDKEEKPLEEYLFLKSRRQRGALNTAFKELQERQQTSKTGLMLHLLISQPFLFNIRTATGTVLTLNS